MSPVIAKQGKDCQESGMKDIFRHVPAFTFCRARWCQQNQRPTEAIIKRLLLYADWVDYWHRHFYLSDWCPSRCRRFRGCLLHPVDSMRRDQCVWRPHASWTVRHHEEVRRGLHLHLAGMGTPDGLYPPLGALVYHFPEWWSYRSNDNLKILADSLFSMRGSICRIATPRKRHLPMWVVKRKMFFFWGEVVWRRRNYQNLHFFDTRVLIEFLNSGAFSSLIRRFRPRFIDFWICDGYPSLSLSPSLFLSSLVFLYFFCFTPSSLFPQSCLLPSTFTICFYFSGGRGGCLHICVYQLYV